MLLRVYLLLTLADCADIPGNSAAKASTCSLLSYPVAPCCEGPCDRGACTICQHSLLLLARPFWVWMMLLARSSMRYCSRRVCATHCPHAVVAASLRQFWVRMMILARSSMRYRSRRVCTTHCPHAVVAAALRYRPSPDEGDPVGGWWRCLWPIRRRKKTRWRPSPGTTTVLTYVSRRRRRLSCRRETLVAVPRSTRWPAAVIFLGWLSSL